MDFLQIKANVDNLSIEKINPSLTPTGKFGNFILKHHTIRTLAVKTTPNSLRKKIGEKTFQKNRDMKITEEQKKILKNLFDDDVLKLQKFLNLELPWTVNS